MATITNYHTLGGLKQYKFILLYFWKPEVQNQFHWAKVKVLAGLVPSGSSRECVHTSFLASESCLHSLACEPFLALFQPLAFDFTLPSHIL